MFLTKINTLICVSSRIKPVKLGVPLTLQLHTKDEVKWDTSFGRVGHHHIRSRIVNLNFDDQLII